MHRGACGHGCRAQCVWHEQTRVWKRGSETGMYLDCRCDGARQRPGIHMVIGTRVSFMIMWWRLWAVSVCYAVWTEGLLVGLSFEVGGRGLPLSAVGWVCCGRARGTCVVVWGLWLSRCCIEYPAVLQHPLRVDLVSSWRVAAW
eukprot:2172502-Amphidinium_carterae.1